MKNELQTLTNGLHDLAAEWRKKGRQLDDMAIQGGADGDSEKRWMTKAGMFRGCASDLKQVLKANGVEL